MNLAEIPVVQPAFSTGTIRTLVPYLRFILDEQLQTYAAIQLQLAKHHRLPILRFFGHLSEQELLNLTVTGTKALFRSIIEGRIEEYLEVSRHRWLRDELPLLIGRNEISGDDIILLSHIRKAALLELLPAYTSDTAATLAICTALDEFFLGFNLYHGAAFSAIFREKVREEAQVKENEERMRLAIESTGLGTWDFDLRSGRIIASARCREILGMDAGTELTFESFLEHIPPEERERVARNNREVMTMEQGKTDYDTEYPFIGINDGKIRWVRAKGKVLQDEAGNPARFIGTVLDITEKKKAELLLQENESRFELLADTMPQMIWVARKDGEITYFNRQWTDYTGLTVEDANRSWERVVHKDDIANTRHHWERSLASGEPLEVETRLLGKDGNYRWFLTRALAVREDDGEIYRWFGTSTDIHDQKRAEESLLFQSRVLESMEEGVSVSDEDGYILLTNKAEDRMFGYEPGELIGKHVTVQNAYTREENERLVTEVIEQLRHKGQWCGEWHNIRKDGTPFYTFSNISALHVGNRNLFICVQRDITEEKRHQDALRESEERFRSMADDAPMLVWMADAAANLVYYNKATQDYVGSNRDEFLRDGWARITHPDDIGAVYEIYSKAQTNPAPFAVECRLRGGDNQYRWFLFKGVPRYHKDQFIGFIGTALDIEDQKRFTRELEARVEKRTKDLIEINNKLERSNQELEQFAYVASHDLQEPLRKISAFGNILVSRYKPGLGNEGADLINRMQSAAERMRTLIDELLTYSRVSRQAEKLPVRLSDLIREVMVDMETSIREKQAIIQVDELGTVVGNPMQLRQLFQNLISNSLKFSKDDQIPAISISSKLLKGAESGLSVISGDEEKLFFQIDVKDNGIGFEQQYAEKIFQVFQRLHGRTEYPGSGVGLSIVQKVVENHKGYIIAESTPGAGACFRILLPAGDAEMPVSG